MLLDLGVIVLVAILAIAGGISGALAQLVRLAALLLAALFAAPVGGLLQTLLTQWISLPQRIAPIASAAIAFSLLLLLFRWTGFWLARRITAAGEVRALDRGGGALLGAVKAMVIGWIIASAWVGLEDLLGTRWGTESSFAAAVARSCSVFGLGASSPTDPIP